MSIIRKSVQIDKRQQLKNKIKVQYAKQTGPYLRSGVTGVNPQNVEEFCFHI